MQENAIVLSQVVKQFGEEQVLKEITHEFEAGKVHGIVGNNGSGKTVMFKCICGFMRPTSGKILVRGKEVGKDIDFPERMGIIIETPGFLPFKTGFRNLQILASIKGTIKREDIIRVLERVGLDAAMRKPVSKYSLGMRQRLGIAQAIMEEPDLLILDEPLHGLDMVNRRLVKDVIEAFCQRKDKTMIMVTHYQEELPNCITNSIYLTKNK